MPRSKTAATNNNEYITNGISISPAIPTVGDSVRLVYDGLLAKSGATDVLAHVGFGNQWENQFDYRMVKTNIGFECTVPVANADTMYVCFKDCANNWDNNTGKNYSFDVTR